MPKYKKKITRPMEYKEFAEVTKDLPPQKKAFMYVLFFAGCRVSEALAVTPDKIHCTPETIFIEFYRLKGSKQTDPQELPNESALSWICTQKEKPFPFSRTTGYRIVKSCFPDLYPHYFRMNRITKTDDEFGDATVYNIYGICASSIDHYRGKVDIKRVGVALRKELKR